jgi:spore coat polysaccharide biosynthesis protein SpsF
MKIVCTIEARMGSTRLPGKTMKPILGKPMLELMIERIKRSTLINDIIVATTIKPADQVIEDLTHKVNVHCFRGSEDDVLERVLQAAKSVYADIIVETTADCPLIDPGLMDDVIQFYLNNPYDYVSNFFNPGFSDLGYHLPFGLVVQVFSVDILEKTAQLTNDPQDREHVSIFIYTHPEIFSAQLVPVPAYINYPKLRLTVDYPEDFELVKRIYEALYLHNPTFSITDVIDFLKNHPSLHKKLYGES